MAERKAMVLRSSHGIRLQVIHLVRPNIDDNHTSSLSHRSLVVMYTVLLPQRGCEYQCVCVHVFARKQLFAQDLHSPETSRHCPAGCDVYDMLINPCCLKRKKINRKRTHTVEYDDGDVIVENLDTLKAKLFIRWLVAGNSCDTIDLEYGHDGGGRDGIANSDGGGGGSGERAANATRCHTFVDRHRYVCVCVWVYTCVYMRTVVHMLMP